VLNVAFDDFYYFKHTTEDRKYIKSI